MNSRPTTACSRRPLAHDGRGSAPALGGQHRSRTVKTFVAQTADQWRKWLDEHHDSESEVWLIFYKLHTGVGGMSLRLLKFGGGSVDDYAICRSF